MAQITEIPTQEISDDIRWNRLLLRRFEVYIAEAFTELRLHGIEPILIKGWAASQNYPVDRPRQFSDIDLAVSSKDHDRAFELSHAAPLNLLNIDIHRELRHLDTVAWNTLFGRSKLETIDNTEIRILCAEDHLRVMCVHWLVDGGQYKERLWDIYYAVMNRPADFDWDKCFADISPTRRKWIIITIAIAKKYLELDVSGLPFAGETDTIPKWMIRCLEKEWASDVRLRSLHTCVSDPKLFWQQILKRIPPNPIESTVEMEGKFDDSLRTKYQIGSIFARIVPSIQRLGPSLWQRITK